MSEMFFTAQDGGVFSAFVARPAVMPAPALIIIQEIFGVNDGLRQKATEMAALGYLAIVPDLFWRLEPGVDLSDKTEAEWEKAFSLMQRFNIDQGVRDLADVLTALRTHPECSGTVGCMGYCLGGKLAYLMAARTDVDVSVSYYGVGLQDLLGEAKKITRPLMLHIAGADAYVPPEAQEAIMGGLKHHAYVTIHHYPGKDHAFSRINGQHYDADAAAVANDRTNAFLRSGLKA
ncbi:MAG: dienelactone hydrolase family protein [Pseudomonadota bacterium]